MRTNDYHTATIKAHNSCRDDGRELLATNVVLDKYKSQCGEMKYPVGSIWINTGEVYGPIPVKQEKAA